MIFSEIASILVSPKRSIGYTYMSATQPFCYTLVNIFSLLQVQMCRPVLRISDDSDDEL